MTVRYRTVAFQTVGGASATTTTIYTVPADRTLILKRWLLHVTAAGAEVRFLLFRAGVQIVVFLYASPTLNALGDAPVDDVVLQEGDQLRVFTAAGLTAAVHVSGSLLAGDPT